jgi:16S rRNA processing protein RimM
VTVADGTSDKRWVPLAEVARPHGVKGEVRLKLYNEESDLLLEQDEVLVRLPDGTEHEVSVDKARRAHDAILMKLHSIDDRDRAEEIRGAVLCVRREAFAELGDGEFYVSDIEGAVVWVKDDAGPSRVGTVKELRSYPSVEVLVVGASDGGKDWEVPLVDAFVERVDAEAREVWLTSLEGLERA